MEHHDDNLDLDSPVGPVPIEGRPPEFSALENDAPVRREAARLLEIVRNGGSVLTDRDVWTKENIEILIERFVKQPDVSGNSFFTKLDGQLEGVHDDVRVLFAEIFLLQMLPITQFRKETKVRNIMRVLRDAEGNYELPQEILDAFDSPLFSGGTAYGVRRYFQLAMLIEFARYVRTLTESELATAYAEPLAWRELVNNAPGTPEPSLRGALVYMGHPGYYLPIVAEWHKESIVDAFYPEVTHQQPSGDSDVDLAALRKWMTPDPIVTPDFYSEPLASYWLEEDDDDEGENEGDDDGDGTVDVKEYTIQSIVDDGAFHPIDELRSIVERWAATRNVILQGAPGTGKSWLAKRLAFALIGQKLNAAVRTVQFHPGTSYEDFVRGWRPGGDGSLTLVDGPLLQHAERARRYPDIPHVIIIEEFNRGNPAQALGEMLTLLERTKRSEAEALELTYMRDDEEEFWLPENLHVIGTMNTADRSLALVDFALRRRFAFFDLEPQLNDKWRAHLKSRFRAEPSAHIDEAARRVNALNDVIAEDVGLGRAFRIGHSYFTPETKESEFEPWFRSVVHTAVAPQLAEYWHDDQESVARETDRLLARF
ncbi:AAA family ATPase [Dietzia sp. 179-F 9C3 NHS]|uniref:AAA family ATPase n=1 Tax=Dietzia sp. 179-F 9C3 NHS TaxID=3374295 RepID=UPI00387A04AB